MKKIFPLFVSLILLLSACGSTPTPAPTNPVIQPSPVAPSETPLPSETPTLAPTDTATVTPAPTLGIGSSRISVIDGLEMVYVPAGPFTMGYNGGYPDEGPEHTVSLNAYWIDQTEVTNGAYEKCVVAGVCKRPSRNTSNGIDVYYNNAQYGNFPVIFMNWDQAQTYCTWAGGRLPSEAEWEKAARGTDGRLYPWGNNPPDETLLNFDSHIWDVTEVDAYPAGASPYGALDMAGNVWEWTADWYGSKYYSQSPAENPTGPDTGTKKVLKGGSWNFDAPGARASYRLSKEPAFIYADIGFRCVQAAP
jgi:eukaryotic-like serine/threonine-protein kinase